MTLSPSHFASHSLPRLARWTMATLALSASACGSLATRQASLNTEPAVPTASAVRTGAAAPSARAQSESPELLVDEAVETEAAGRVAIVPVNGRRALVRQSLRAASRISIPRPGDCPAGGCQPGAPCETCADGCCDEDRYPDEYLCDGGDRDEPVHYDQEGMLGLDTQDTVAEFHDSENKRRVRRTNEVCVYAPRFSSVTVISGALEDALQTKANQNQQELRQVAVHRPDLLVVARQRDLADPLTSKVRGNVVLNADLAFDVNRPLAPAFLSNELVPITYFDYLQVQIAKQAQEAFEAIQVQNAVVWTRVQTPVIVAKDDAVQIVEARFKVEELAGTDPKGPGNLRITKLADLKIAAQDDEITFTIRYQNQGDSPVTEVTIVDNLTPRLEYIEGSQTNSLPSQFETLDNGEGSKILRWELDEPLPGRTTGTITFRARVR